MAKIISIVWYKVLPPLFGGQKGIAHFNKCLSSYHTLCCICSKDNISPAHLPYKILPLLPLSKWQFINPSCLGKIVSITKKEKPDYVVLEHPYHGFAASKIKKRTGAKLIVHAHNIESERFRQEGKWWWWILRNYEKWVFKKADLVLFKTRKDKEFSIKHFLTNSSKCILIPYGIEKKELPDQHDSKKQIRQKHRIAADEKILLFAGTLDYSPNAKAVEDIYEKIAPRLELLKFCYKIIICGRNKTPAFHYLSKLSHDSVIAAGETDDIETYFAAADIFINPVQEGGGVQTKTIEALGNNCSTVCFAAMAEGIPAELTGNKLLLARDGDWNNFVSMIVNGTNDWQKTPESFFNSFDWHNVIQPLLTWIKTDEAS